MIPRAFATHLLEDGHHIRTVQALLGHRDVTTTQSDTHVLNRGLVGVHRPADQPVTVPAYRYPKRDRIHDSLGAGYAGDPLAAGRQNVRKA